MPNIAVHDSISKILRLLAEAAKPGVKLQTLYDLLDKQFEGATFTSINENYDDGRGIPFPRKMCVNINSAIAHGIPSVEYTLKDNDIINFDLGIQDKKTKDCADAALTVGVGIVESYNTKLMAIAKEALYQGIDAIKPGQNIFVIGEAMEGYTTRKKYAMSKTFLSHAIGKEMHEKPTIPNVRIKLDPTETLAEEFIIKVGQRFCIEPIVTQYDNVGRAVGDGWTVITKDGRNSAMFEHMVEVTKDGCRVLTTHIERD